MTEIRELFRPVGLYELRLIRDSGYTAFPPRLPDQPIFYPVLNRDYAEQIAQRWNVPDAKSGYMGAVTAFDVDTVYLAQYEEKTVGGALHKELWVPAQELAAFNRHIVGEIRVVAAFYGAEYEAEREW